MWPGPGHLGKSVPELSAVHLLVVPGVFPSVTLRGERSTSGYTPIIFARMSTNHVYSWLIINTIINVLWNQFGALSYVIPLCSPLGTCKGNYACYGNPSTFGSESFGANLVARVLKWDHFNMEMVIYIPAVLKSPKSPTWQSSSTHYYIRLPENSRGATAILQSFSSTSERALIQILETYSPVVLQPPKLFCFESRL